MCCREKVTHKILFPMSTITEGGIIIETESLSAPYPDLTHRVLRGLYSVPHTSPVEFNMIHLAQEKMF